jgi:hypothetical protein
VQSAVEEKSSGGLGEESERKTERRVRGERDRRGWAVRGFMARATKRRGVSRSFPRRAGEASRCAPQRLAPWKRSIQRYPQGLSGGCFDARAGQENEGAQKSNQRPLSSPEPGLILRTLPNAPLAERRSQSNPRSSVYKTALSTLDKCSCSATTFKK